MKTIIFILVLICSLSFLNASEVKNINPENRACDVCKFVVSYATHLVNQSRPDIIEYMNKGCELLPPDAVRICKTFVQLYGNELINYIVEQGKNPEVFCAAIKLCSVKNDFGSFLPVEPVQGADLTMKSSACSMCQFVIKAATDYVGNNKEELLKFIVAQCDKLPSGVNQVCKTFVTLYGNQLIEYIIDQGKNPKEFCTKVGLCSAENDMTIADLQQMLSEQNGALCEVCKFVVKAAVGYVNGTADELLKYLNEQCAKLPNGVDKICKTVVTIYGRDLVDWIVNKGKDPHLFCAYVKLCSSAPVNTEINQACQLCQLGAAFAKQFLDGKTDEEFLEYFIYLCNQIPGNGGSMCKTFVGMYGKEVLKVIRESLADPRAFCQSFGICPKAQTSNVAKCIFNCLKGKVSFGDIVKAIFKCKKDIKCYVKELQLDEKTVECVSQCL